MQLVIDNTGESPDDEAFIDGVFNYCDRRCTRCAFTARCRLFADVRRDEQANPGSDWKARVHRSFDQTIEMIRRWCAREGIDFERFLHDAQLEDTSVDLKRIQQARQDPLQQLAMQYSAAATRIVAALRRSPDSDDWPAATREALETIEWFGLQISSKIHRALVGFLEWPDEDPAQADWNGSAKVARLDVAESRAAWVVVLETGEAPIDSPLRRMIGLLDEIDAIIADRFPAAMAFVRPGFDSPMTPQP